MQAWLGVERDTPRDRVEAAYRALRAHVEARATTSSDAPFAEARREEIAQLDASFEFAWPRRSGARPGRRARIALLAWAAAATALALGLALALWRAKHDGPSAVDTPTMAHLSVLAEPEASRLRVTRHSDEEIVFRGLADGQPLELAPGRYDLLVARDDCPDPWQRDITLARGQERRLGAQICRGEGRLVVRSNVKGDRVRIDGVDVGATGEQAHSLAVGEHSVRVEKAGYRAWSAKVRVRPGEEITLSAEMPAAPAAAEQRTPGPTEKPGPVGKNRESAALTSPASATTSAERPPEATRTEGPTFKEGVSDPVIRTGKGGSKSWHDRLRDRLLADYDSDGSGRLDRPEEIDAIPCTEWRSIESAYETGGLRVPMTRLYGFDGSSAPANTLGVAASMRPHAFDRMKSCGLR